jgi:outer membrane lipoprotein-sorting protein
MDEAEITRQLEQLSKVEPSAAATRQAIDRARATLNNPISITSRRRIQMITRYSAMAASVLVIAVAGVLLFGPAQTGNLAFADVKDKVEQTKSVSITFTHPDDDGKTVTDKSYALADGRVRTEETDGSYNVIDAKAGISLVVNVSKKEALVIHGYHDRGIADIYQMVRNIRKDEVRKLPAEKIDGRDAEVFLAKVKSPYGEQEVKVWVDPKTQLPFREEFTVESPDKKVKQTFRLDLEFDKPLDLKLFSTTPPDGFIVRSEGSDKPLQPAKRENLQSPTVIPGEGIGPVKFGMSKKEVIEKLGEPDKIDQRGLALDYLSRGYSIMVHPKRGVMMITCYTQATFVVKVKDFAGKTKEGIAMGASAADIVKAYGEPDDKETKDETTYLKYRKKLKMEFTLFNDKLVQYSLNKD